jgi:hypothetical protein
MIANRGLNIVNRQTKTMDQQMWRYIDTSSLLCLGYRRVQRVREREREEDCGGKREGKTFHNMFQSLPAEMDWVNQKSPDGIVTSYTF